MHTLKKIHRYITLCIILALSQYGITQTADITSGCAPLTVQFNGGEQTTYYWDFNDGAKSEDPNPINTFTNPGTYEVRLLNSPNGTVLGSITIKVYPKPDIKIKADVKEGCGPLVVQFSNESIVNPDIIVTSYFWDFGDGSTSTEENPEHVFADARTYNVLLRIESENGCTESEFFSEFISVNESISGGLEIDTDLICDLPATINLTNLTENNPQYTFFWDFGDGQSSEVHDPGSVTYTQAGRYTIKLKVSIDDDCEVEYRRVVNVGKPSFNLVAPDTICINDPTVLAETSSFSFYKWSFIDPVLTSPKDVSFVEVTYETPGLKTIKLESYYDPECAIDTTFSLYVEDPSVTIVADPLMSCDLPQEFQFTAQGSSTDMDYMWEVSTKPDFSDVIHDGDGQNFSFTRADKKRDSIQILHIKDYFVKLEGVSNNGCRAASIIQVQSSPSEARFLPSAVRGCAPLTFDLEDISHTSSEIIEWQYLLDGESIYSSDENGDFNYTLNEPGEYKIRMIVNTEAGCNDTSAGVWFYVGEQLDVDYTIDERGICLYDDVTVTFDNIDPRLDAWHINTDGGRFNHCYKSPSGTHTFVHEPGTHPVTIETIYNGCENEIDAGVINVSGTKARIKYMTNCESPYTVMLQDSSVNHSNAIWVIEGDTIDMNGSTGEIMNHTFDTRGPKEVTLISMPMSGDACNPDTARVSFFVTEVKADFQLPDVICADSFYDLDASTSIDVDTRCHAGYLWYGVALRPREIDETVLEDVGWEAGPVEVTLITEDVNGCTDTLTQISEAYEIEAAFEMDKDEICLPSTVSFSDKTTTNSQIDSYEWNFGSSLANPSHTFTSGNDSLFVFLTVTDIHGCSSSTSQILNLYKPESEIYSNTPVCKGETLELFATDSDNGSSLAYDWDLGLFGDYDIQDPEVKVNRAGVFNISLTVTEESTGCKNEIPYTIEVVDYPDARFTSEPDDLLCPKESVEFYGEAGTSDPVSYIWDYGDGGFGIGKNSIHTFPNGDYNVMLIVQTSKAACRDTFIKTLSFKGPEADFNTSSDIICNKDELELTLIDTSNIATYTWDLGDGTEVKNTSPLVHVYAFDSLPSDNRFPIDLIVESPYGCKEIFTKYINLYEVLAAFEIVDGENNCPGYVKLEDQSIGVGSLEWNFGDGNTSTENDPEHYYSSEGDYTITLSVTDPEALCTDTRTETITVDGNEEVQMPNIFSPNNDGVNDYFNVAIREEYAYQLECIEVVKAKIFNRWGNLVYDNRLPAEGWDGKYDNGDDAPAEVYTYVFEVQYFNGITQMFKGTVTLVK